MPRRRPTFISTFAGIGGFDLGLERAGWECIGQVEIDPYCRQVLAKHWPDVPRHDDIRTAKEWWLSEDRPKADLVTGGFPCQDVSVAGKRAGLGKLDDATRTRTGLFYDAIDFIAAVQPDTVLLENVPGLLTSNRGADFAVVLDSLAEGGFVDLEWRVLDSQHFGVPQRRRRVFVVGRAGHARGRPVLLESEGVRGDLAASEQARAHAAAAAAGGARGSRGPGLEDAAPVTVSTLMGGGQRGYRIGAEEAAGNQILPVLTNPVDGGVARCIVGGAENSPNNKHDATRTNYIAAPAPQLFNNGQQPNDLARTLTAGTGKRYDPDTESVVVAATHREDTTRATRAEAPRRRIIRRPRTA